MGLLKRVRLDLTCTRPGTTAEPKPTFLFFFNCPVQQHRTPKQHRTPISVQNPHGHGTAAQASPATAAAAVGSSGDGDTWRGGAQQETQKNTIALPCSCRPLRFPSSSSTATAHATAMWGFSGIWRLQQPSVAMWRRQQSSTAAVVLWRKNGDEKLTVLLLRRDQIYFNPIDLRYSLI